MEEKLKPILAKVKENKIIGTAILSIIFIIIFIMNIGIASKVSFNFRSELDKHPDENAHYEAVQYYTKHFMPPKFTDEEIRYSYSEYGESRLTELDSYYFFCGKYTSILNLFSKNEVFNARTFNLLLFVIIAVLCIRLYRKDSYLFLPFLLTSQIWYVFSYIDNDAWAIFWNLIFVYQLFYQKSMFNNFINASGKTLKKEKGKTIAKILALGVLFYILLTLKINFVLATGICAIIYLIVNNKKACKKENLFKIGFILLIGVLLLGVRLVTDVAINGLDRYTKMEEIRISRARDKYQPPYDSARVPRFKMKERGEPLSKVLTDVYIRNLRTSFIGVYGYMDKFASIEEYRVVTCGYIIIALYVIIANVIKKKKDKEHKMKEWQKGRILPIALVVTGRIINFIF